MNYSTFPPTEKLAGYVRFFWVLESEELTAPYIYRSMADSCTELLFHYRGTFDEITADGKISDSFLSGIHSQTATYRRFVTNERFGIFGVYLYPFAVRRLLNLSPAELTDHMPDLFSAMGRRGKELEEQVMAATDNGQRYRILSRFLERQFDKTSADSHPALSAVRYVISSKSLQPVRALAGHFNLSERQFERKFKEYSGLSPKLCMRIVRFGEACNHYIPADGTSLAKIAHECGYYDQSHFIHDFREFSGYGPGTFFSGKAEGIEWREQESVCQGTVCRQCHKLTY